MGGDHGRPEKQRIEEIAFILFCVVDMYIFDGSSSIAYSWKTSDAICSVSYTDYQPLQNHYR
jgi:hypothetical protein